MIPGPQIIKLFSLEALNPFVLTKQMHLEILMMHLLLLRIRYETATSLTLQQPAGCEMIGGGSARVILFVDANLLWKAKLLG